MTPFCKQQNKWEHMGKIGPLLHATKLLSVLEAHNTKNEIKKPWQYLHSVNITCKKLFLYPSFFPHRDQWQKTWKISPLSFLSHSVLFCGLVFKVWTFFPYSHLFVKFAQPSNKIKEKFHWDFCLFGRDFALSDSPVKQSN